jgi:hypothetical protein
MTTSAPTSVERDAPIAVYGIVRDAVAGTKGGTG